MENTGGSGGGNTGNFSRIDSHQHFTREYLPSLLLGILKRNRFDGTVVVAEVPAEVPAKVPPVSRIASVEENRWLLGLAAEHAFIRGVVCWADLADPGLARPDLAKPDLAEPDLAKPDLARPGLARLKLSDLLDEYQGHPKFRGVCSTCDGDLPAGLEELSRRGLTLDLPARLETVARIAQKFPALRLAIDHIGRPSLMEAPPDRLAALARFPNVFVKISGLITDAPTQWKATQFAPWLRAALAAFGAERVMFGSDWPSYLPVGTWKESLAAFTQALGAQTMETREQVLGATARRFYRLDHGA